MWRPPPFLPSPSPPTQGGGAGRHWAERDLGKQRLAQREGAARMRWGLQGKLKGTEPWAGG